MGLLMQVQHGGPMVTFRGEKFKEKTITLFRPVGPKELELIEATEWKRFPPRLPDQPIFYPVTSDSYAAKIARDWNVPASGAGYVLEFSVKADFLAKYPLRTVGGKDCQEYWIPAEELEDFNDAIVGRIWDIMSFCKWYIYILECADGTLYTGITNNLDRRIKQHNEGKGAKYTRGRGPCTLVKFFTRNTKSDALKLERKIKKLPREEKLKFNE
jgi:predicted GIY-YIG superfamily endonuclease